MTKGDDSEADPPDGAGETRDSELRELLGMRPMAAPVTLHAGQIVDDGWRIERVLGAGGMGVVYLARDLRLGRDVALKVHRVAAGDRSMAEASALATLVHANVVTVHQIGTWNGHPFVVMEYVPGGTARSWLAAKPRRRDEILALYIAAGRGLAAAHASGLIHRDFKPDNVLVSDDGRIRVADFGLARRVGSDEDADAILGTPAYMAPEQRHRGDVGPSADQFAFAVALWEALTGALPFVRELDARAAAIEAGELRRPPRRMPRGIVAALRRALASEPAARFATMDDLLAALAPRSRKAAWIAGLAMVGAGAAAGALALGASDDASEIATWAPRIEPHLPSYDEDSYAPVISPDGTQIVYSTDRDRPSWFRLHLAPVRGGPSREIPMPASVIATFPRWADDGRSIVFTNAADDFTAYRIATDGGTPERLAGPGAFVDDCNGRLLFAYLGTTNCSTCERLVIQEPGRPAREVLRVDGVYIANSARCDRAGRRAVYAQKQFDDFAAPASLWVVDLDTGAKQQVLDDRHRNARPTFHPDGTSILFTSDRGGHNNLWELPLDGRAPIQLTFGTETALGPDVTADGSMLVFNFDDTATPVFARALMGGERRRITPTRPNLFTLDVTPDNRELVSISLGPPRRVVMFGIADGSERVIDAGVAAAVTLDGREIVYASAAPTTIRAVARTGGTPRTLGTVDGRIELMKIGPDGFVHLMVIRAGAREAWQIPLAGGTAERSAPSPWCFIHPAPVGGWRMARQCPGSAPPTGHLFRAGAELDLSAPGFVSIDGDWDRRGETYVTYDLSRLRQVTAATGAVRDLFEVVLATGLVLAPDGRSIYLAEYVSRVRRALITNLADRPGE